MSYNLLTEYERYQIYALKKAGHNQAEIAALLDRHTATISREIRRNGGLRGYRPKQAQMLSDTRRDQAYKARKISDEVYDQVDTLLRQKLSPHQVASYLNRH